MFRMIRLTTLALGLALTTLLPQEAVADVPTFNNLTQDQFNNVVRELSGNFSYSSVTPASSLGSVWGLEFGVVGGITKTPDILDVVKSADPTTTLKDNFPHAGALVRLGVPLGLTFEAQVVPKTKISDLSMKQTGGAVQWTITDVFFTDAFLTAAIKAFYTKDSFDYSEVLNNSSTNFQNVNATVDYSEKLYGSTFLLSKKLLIFEPYVGVGYLHGDGTLGVTGAGSATIFGQTFAETTGQSATSKPTSSQVLGGLDIRLAFISLGAEYQRSFAVNSFTGRFSFRF